MKIDYDTAAGAYTRFRRVNPKILGRLIQLGQIGRESCVLEVGSGSGNYITAIAELTECRSHGLEPSKGMLAKAMERGGAVAWVHGNAQALPFADESFDFLYCVDVIHHVSNPEQFLEEAFRVLRGCGRLCIVTDSEWTIRNRNPLTRYFPETVDEELKRYPSIERLKGLIVASGFSGWQEEIVETPHALETADAFRKKAFSCLHLISESSFQRGLAALSSALEDGPLPCVDRSFLLHATKGKTGMASRPTHFTR